jgi:hypothetical protein
MRSLLSFRVFLHENGLAQRSGANQDLVLWSDVVTMKEIVLYERPPLLVGAAQYLLPKFASRTYAVWCRDDRKFGFSVHSIKNVDRLGEMLRQVSLDRGIPWMVQEID